MDAGTSQQEGKTWKQTTEKETQASHIGEDQEKPALHRSIHKNDNAQLTVCNTWAESVLSGSQQVKMHVWSDSWITTVHLHIK